MHCGFNLPFRDNFSGVEHMSVYSQDTSIFSFESSFWAFTFMRSYACTQHTHAYTHTPTHTHTYLLTHFRCWPLLQSLVSNIFLIPLEVSHSLKGDFLCITFSVWYNFSYVLIFLQLILLSSYPKSIAEPNIKSFSLFPLIVSGLMLKPWIGFESIF